METGQCKLFSWTPVQSIDRQGSGWEVKTSRGNIKTERVVLASNAHTQHLWKTSELPFDKLYVLVLHTYRHSIFAEARRITTCRGHCCHVTPPTNFAGPGAMDESLSWGGTYLRDVAGAGWVVGCGAQSIREYGLAKREEYMNVVDDSKVCPGVERCKHLEYCDDCPIAADLSPRSDFNTNLAESLIDWKEIPGEGTRRQWSGIMGYSRDTLPFIGPVPQSPGLYAAVAFHGHGRLRNIQ